MDEYVAKSYKKEEEFLDDFGDFAPLIKELLNGDWTPNYFADDETRRSDKYFFSTGQLTSLVFDSAYIFYQNGFFSSVQILFRSSYRSVTGRVHKNKDSYIGSIINDKDISPDEK